MSNKATQSFESAIDELQVQVAAVEESLANPKSGICLSGSQMLDVHYRLIELSERLFRCARTVPPIESAVVHDELIALWEVGSCESSDSALAACNPASTIDRDFSH
jgi:hypothetical protein